MNRQAKQLRTLLILLTTSGLSVAALADVISKVDFETGDLSQAHNIDKDDKVSSASSD